MPVEETKGGRGPVGSHVKAPGGAYIHERKASPKGMTDFRTITTKSGNKIRIGHLDGKTVTQAVLKKIKGK